jgi:hypothetical protein
MVRIHYRQNDDQTVQARCKEAVRNAERPGERASATVSQPCPSKGHFQVVHRADLVSPHVEHGQSANGRDLKESVTAGEEHMFNRKPVATIALYGPDDKLATKLVVGIVMEQDAEPAALNRWFSTDQDVRSDLVISGQVLQFIKDQRAKSVIMTDRIIGCANEEGVDYGEGAVCPHCPFWARRDPWSGDLIQ